MTERFTLLTELGRGGMGVVWKARDEESGSIVALKLLREAYAEDPEYLARFERELELARRIDSVHVVKVLGFGVREKVPYLALEYVDGPSLHAALVQHGPYSWPETRALLTQLTQGLADANAAGVIHRDVKPSNVLIDPDGVAKLTDFGIARGLDLTRMTATSTLLGTPAYMAPEGPKDARSDLYSLGIIGYELLTGAVPFKGTSYQEVVVDHIRTPPDLSKLPPEARSTIGWLLEKDPASRPQRASELLPVLYGATHAPAAAAAAVAAHFSRPAAADPRSRQPQTYGPLSGIPVAHGYRVVSVRRSRTPTFLGVGAVALVAVIGLGTVLMSAAGRSFPSTLGDSTSPPSRTYASSPTPPTVTPPPATAGPTVSVVVITQITDQAGVLGADQIRVQTALDGLFSHENVDLWLVLVPSLNGMTAPDLATAIFTANGLGGNDAVLVISVGDHRYGWAEDTATGLPITEIDSLIDTDATPLFANGYYADGIIDFVAALGQKIDAVRAPAAGPTSTAPAAAGIGQGLAEMACDEAPSWGLGEGVLRLG